MSYSYQQNQSYCQNDERGQQHTTGSVNESFVFKLSLKDYILRLLILGSSENKYDPRKKVYLPKIRNILKPKLKMVTVKKSAISSVMFIRKIGHLSKMLQ